MRIPFGFPSIIAAMHSLPVEIYSVASVRAIDRRAMDEAGIPGYTLMQRAGEAAVRECLSAYPRAKRWQVLCGPGNNGGDGFVVGRFARAAGLDVRLLCLADPADLEGDAGAACKAWLSDGGSISPWRGTLAADADLVVDALFGSGLGRPLAGDYAAAAAAINRHSAPVVALDMPSGIDGDTGESHGPAVEAAMTVTFVGLKSGLFLADGFVASGRVRYAGLDIPDSCRKPERPQLLRIGRHQLRDQLPLRRRDAHKGDFGHVLVVGGGAGMPGAVRLCGEAALRSGAGKVSLATHPAHAAAIGAACPELITHGVESGDELKALLAAADVLAFGPGLGTGDWSREMYREVARSELPAVWDADALNLLAGGGEEPCAAPGERILTPHPGEAGRLLGRPADEVQRERPASVRALRERFGGVAVLKGAGTLIAGRDDVPHICLAGNAGMAAAGMGDVLTGIIAALRAQGLSAETAALSGVTAHAAAGDRAAARGMRGLVAGDLIAELRGILNPASGAAR
jgi:ADP-dependent NAD(P)H-hydrate dehydratase / NAD(P)H-hydrate epimerase